MIHKTDQMRNPAGVPTTLSHEDLKPILAEALAAAPETIRFEATATGKFNYTWFVGVPGQEREYVIRVAPPPDRSRMLFYEHLMMRQEPALHAKIRTATSCPVPEILAHRWEDPSLGGRDWVLMERLPGAPISWIAESTMEVLGARLREVHDRVLASASRYGYLGEHRPMEPQSTWQAAFHDMWRRLLDDLRNWNGLPSAEIAHYRNLLDRHLDHFDHFREPAPLLHMDVWAENILTDSEGRLTGLIDWDRACWGDPEIEFAILDYCGISTPGFWQGYSPDGLDPRSFSTQAALRRVFYLLYEILKYIVIRIARNGDPAGAERYRQMARQLAGQLE